MCVWFKKAQSFSFSASFNTSCELQAFKDFFQENGKLDHKYHFTGETGNEHGWSFPLKCLDLSLQVDLATVLWRWDVYEDVKLFIVQQQNGIETGEGTFQIESAEKHFGHFGGSKSTVVPAAHNEIREDVAVAEGRKSSQPTLEPRRREFDVEEAYAELIKPSRREETRRASAAVSEAVATPGSPALNLHLTVSTSQSQDESSKAVTQSEAISGQEQVVDRRKIVYKEKSRDERSAGSNQHGTGSVEEAYAKLLVPSAREEKRRKAESAAVSQRPLHSTTGQGSNPSGAIVSQDKLEARQMRSNQPRAGSLKEKSQKEEISTRSTRPRAGSVEAPQRSQDELALGSIRSILKPATKFTEAAARAASEALQWRGRDSSSETEKQPSKRSKTLKEKHK